MKIKIKILMPHGFHSIKLRLKTTLPKGPHVTPLGTLAKGLFRVFFPQNKIFHEINFHELVFLYC